MLDKNVPYIGVLMICPDPAQYPRVDLPPSYTFYRYEPGLEQAWGRLQVDSGQSDSQEKAEALFTREFLADPAAAAQRCFFVLGPDHQVVGTASLWFGDHFGTRQERVHWVTVAAAEQGRGIAKALLTRLFDCYHELGCTGQIYLTTQTWSYRAINLYTRFGFVPYRGDKPPGWRAEDFTADNERAWRLIEAKIAARQG
jgi:GNAT superfamily N-acetyltransferase